MRDKKDDSRREFAALLQARENDRRVDERIKEIYQSGPAGQTAGLHRRAVSPWRRLAQAFLFFLVVLSAVSWSGFYLLHQGERLRADDITFSISGPDQIVAGKEEVYELYYKNVSAFILRDVVIRLETPDSFIFLDAVPAAGAVDDKAVVWRLDAVPSKRSGRIAVKAKSIGRVGEAVGLKASLAYRPENFSSTFRTAAAFTNLIASTGVGLTLEAPSFASRGDELPFIVRYVKERESFVKGFTVVLEHGDSFKFVDADTVGIWPVDNLSDTPSELSFGGSYSALPAAGETLTLRAGIPYTATTTATTTEMRYRWFYEQIIPITVVDGALNLSLSLNGSTAERPVNFGDELNYVVHYKNVSDATLRNVVILATLSSPLIDWTTWRDERRGERRDDAVLWTKAEVAGLSALSPDDEGSFGFSVRLKDTGAAAGTAAGEPVVRAALDYSIDSELRPGAAHAVVLSSPLNTAVTFNAQLRYFDAQNNAIGSGPLPPRAGEKTVYRALWSVVSAPNDLKDLETATVLPANVVWENIYTASGGEVVYDGAARRLSWRLPRLDAIGEPAVLEFAVGITPAAADRNKIVTVLNQSHLTATDARTGGAITRETPPKTTALEDDAAGRGKGEVE